MLYIHVRQPSRSLLQKKLLLEYVVAPQLLPRLYYKMLIESSHLGLLQIDCTVMWKTLHLDTLPGWNEVSSDNKRARGADHHATLVICTALQILNNMNESVIRIFADQHLTDA